jgi:hypothetical protein
MPWSTRFHAPIILPDKTELETLDDARRYLTKQKLPKSAAFKDLLATAIKVTMLAAEGKDFAMTARRAIVMYVHRNDLPDEPQPRVKKAKRYRVIR